uniref:Uncharacterized protein n=1 Tax=Arundo donax TaxID=35708 RepID=A0A0A8YV82_ARUDO
MPKALNYRRSVTEYLYEPLKCFYACSFW